METEITVVTEVTDETTAGETLPAETNVVEIVTEALTGEEIPKEISSYMEQNAAYMDGFTTVGNNLTIFMTVSISLIGIVIGLTIMRFVKK